MCFPFIVEEHAMHDATTFKVGGPIMEHLGVGIEFWEVKHLEIFFLVNFP